MTRSIAIVALLVALAGTASAGLMRGPDGKIVSVAPADEQHARDTGYVDVTVDEASPEITRREDRPWLTADERDAILFVVTVVGAAVCVRVYQRRGGRT